MTWTQTAILLPTLVANLAIGLHLIERDGHTWSAITHVCTALALITLMAGLAAS